MLVDSLGRRIDYLRISVTDRCNLRCIYCMPENGIQRLGHDEMLRYEEILRLARIFASLGFNRFRITGGEPLVRKGIVDFVRELSAALPGCDISMSTNGILLAEVAAELKRNGLHRVNISLDSVDPHAFAEVTRGGDLNRVLQGIDEALKAGLVPVKTNTVLMRNVNYGELPDIAALTLSRPIHVRFIELMPLGEACSRWQAGAFVPASEALAMLRSRFQLRQAVLDGGGPARYWRIPGAAGTVGFITAVSSHFCSSCNRVRLTAKGGLALCLGSNLEVDLRTPMRSGSSDEELRRIIVEAIRRKPARHHMGEPGNGGGGEYGWREMFSIGG
ncbi:MAG TPA: GTP 3',8-cyclase MoaA [Firmicutes bacterium]|nr:GTP 3',8-cyclase MoaA [Bacillota bacterium]